LSKVVENTTTLRVLVVGHSEVAAERMAQELAREGFLPCLQQVSSESEYLTALQSGPEVVLSAWSFPPLPGSKALQAVGERGLDVAFLVVCGEIGEEATAEALCSGAADFVHQDRLTRLGPAVRRALKRRRGRQSGEERYRELFFAHPLAMWVYDLETLRFLAVNAAAVRQYGWSEEEFLAMTLHDIRPGDDIGRLEESVSFSRETPGYERSLHWHHRTRDGRVLEVEISSHDLVFEGRPARIVAALDVTERRSLEAQLRHAQKMESVGRLAGGVAHDFNNMLSVILGYTGFALEAVRPGDPLHDDLKQVQSAAERAASLTRQLLAFSRKQVLSPEALDLNDVVRGLEDMLRRLLGEDVELELSLEEGLGSVKADRGQLEQAILNLAVNARDAMPQGGRLSIETADLELDAEHAAHHLGVTPGPYVLLALADTGCGMDEETRSRAFEPFFTTKAPGQGTGLGLAMVYGLVQQSAGSVWLYSEPGRGTVFKIYLPRVDAAVTVPGKRMPDNVERRGTETILIVEDEDAVRMAAERILLAAGYTVVSAANGGEALELCELNSDDIDLLLADVVMPQMSGRELADRVSGLWPNLKILYMSGYSDNALVHHGVLEPGTRLLAKPFTAEDLRRKVREVLDGAEP
jgi:hypothetical protein